MATLTRPDAERVTCRRCSVEYRADRTDGACPVCRVPAADDVLGPAAPSRWAIEDTRSAVILGMSAVNFLFLDVIALALLG